MILELPSAIAMSSKEKYEFTWGKEYIKPRMIILAPTQEIVREQFDELSGLCHRTSIHVAAVYSNRPEVYVINAWRKYDILVTCAGKLADLIRTCLLGLS
jgi:superfamily II DNA/RNA helicase